MLKGLGKKRKNKTEHTQENFSQVFHYTMEHRANKKEDEKEKKKRDGNKNGISKKGCCPFTFSPSSYPSHS